MSLSVSAAVRPMGVPMRALLFGVAAILGLVGGYTWSNDASNFLYNGLLSAFVDPGAKIEPMAMGVGLGFLVGFVHITSI
jgi:hypothetical protein